MTPKRALVLKLNQCCRTRSAQFPPYPTDGRQKLVGVVSQSDLLAYFAAFSAFLMNASTFLSHAVMTLRWLSFWQYRRYLGPSYEGSEACGGLVEVSDRFP